MNEFAVHFLVLLIWIRKNPLAMHPTPLCRKPCCPQGRLHLSEGLRADAIRRWWRGCYFLKPNFTDQTSNTHLTRVDAFHAYEALQKA